MALMKTKNKKNNHKVKYKNVLVFFKEEKKRFLSVTMYAAIPYPL